MIRHLKKRGFQLNCIGLMTNLYGLYYRHFHATQVIQLMRGWISSPCILFTLIVSLAGNLLS